MKTDRLYLVHIQECIRRIESYTGDGAKVFRADARTQDAVVRNLQILAESTQRLTGEIKQLAPLTNWRGIAGFRNILTHNYLGVDLERVWQIVEVFVPQLKVTVEFLLRQLPDEDVAD